MQIFVRTLVQNAIVLGAEPSDAVDNGTARMRGEEQLLLVIKG